MRERIEKIIKNEDISSSKFADIIGIQRSSISHILSGRNKPSLDVIQRILRKYPNINSEWLILGIGNMYKGQNAELDSTPIQKSIFDEENSSDSKMAENALNENISNKVVNDEPNPVYNTKQIINNTKDGNKKIERIIIFFDDGSFKQYTQSV